MKYTVDIRYTATGLLKSSESFDSHEEAVFRKREITDSYDYRVLQSTLSQAERDGSTYFVEIGRGFE